jgi:hypothetical protein
MSVKKIVFIIVPVVVIAAIVVQKWLEARGPGRIVLFAPPDRAATMSFDGAVHALPAGGFARFTAKPGQHQVTVDGGAPRTVTLVDGLSTVGVPADATACYDELDVTLSHYGPSAGKVKPKVVRRYRFEKQFELARMPLSEEELPKFTTDTVGSDGKYKKVELVQLLVAVPCREGVDYSRHM